MMIDLRGIIKFLVMVLGLFTLMMWLSSCSKEYHLKKSQHHYEKAISKGYIPLVDTVYVYDTVRLTGVRYDTIFKDVGDTVRIEKDRLKIKYVRDTITNDVFIDGECQADTIIREVPVTLQEKIYIEKTLLENLGINKTWGKVLFWLIVGIGIVILIVRFIKP